MADVAIPDPYGVAATRKATALKAYNDAIAGINSKKLERAQRAGFKATFDPTTGALSNYQIDPGNRYGEFQQQLARHADSLTSSFHDATARGLGHLGLGAQGEGRLRYLQGAEDSELSRRFMSDISGLVGDQGRAFQDYQSAIDNADSDALAQAIQNRLFDVPATSPSNNPYDYYGGGGTTDTSTSTTDTSAPDQTPVEAPVLIPGDIPQPGTAYLPGEDFLDSGTAANDYSAPPTPAPVETSIGGVSPEQAISIVNSYMTPQEQYAAPDTAPAPAPYIAPTLPAGDIAQPGTAYVAPEPAPYQEPAPASAPAPDPLEELRKQIAAAIYMSGGINALAV